MPEETPKPVPKKVRPPFLIVSGFVLILWASLLSNPIFYEMTAWNDENLVESSQGCSSQDFEEWLRQVQASRGRSEAVLRQGLVFEKIARSFVSASMS